MNFNKMSFKWIAFVAGRYISQGRKNSPSPVFSVLGIATGVLALTIIIAVMNGFQMGFIDSILEISSGHLRMEGVQAEDEAYLSARLRSLPEVISVLPFEEHNVLLRGRQSGVSGALLRAVPVNALELDPGLAERLEMESGRFNLNEPYSIVLGAELARHLLVSVGDDISLLSFAGGLQAGQEDADNLYRVSGIFRSHFYEYDLGWAFISFETAARALSSDDSAGQRHTLGIKLNNRWQDQRAMEIIRPVISGMGEYADGITLSSWRDYNRAFFGALRTEKLMMFILVGLIFIVVGLNIFQAQRRSVLERREEIGLLRALGASDRAVRLIFVWDGFVIGLGGAGIGLILGLLIASNISAFFTLLESIVNFFIFHINNLFFNSYTGPEEFYFFSPRIFYLKEIPSRVIPREVILIFMFGFLSALLAAWFASGKVSTTRPAEVLRYE